MVSYVRGGDPQGVIRLWSRRSDVRFATGVRNFPTLQNAQTAHRTGREAHHTPSSAEVKNEWSYTYFSSSVL